MGRRIEHEEYPDIDQLEKIDIQDNHEKMTTSASLANARIEFRPYYYEQGHEGALQECYLRSSLLVALEKVCESLPGHLGIRIYDGWRPYRLQKALYDEYYARMEKKYSTESADYVKRKTLEFVSYPSTNLEEPYVHGTGGAVDLTLYDMRTGKDLDMGTSFDDFTEKSHTAYFEGIADMSEEEIMVRDNRRSLYYRMIDQGFTNLPTEWWHYDMGDRFHAYYSRQKIAIYGGILDIAQDR